MRRRRARWIAAAAAGLLIAALAAQALLARGPIPPGPGPAGSFAAPAARHSATIWAVGDGADGSAHGKRVAGLIERGHPARLLYLGDVYESGTAAEFKDNYASVYGGLRRATAPTPGNHDWPQHRAGYDPYWAKLTGRRPPDHYSFRLAGWQILSLNSEGPLDEQTVQQRWLRDKLSGPGNCRIAFWHRPRFSAGSHGDQEDVDPIWSALQGRARLVLNGHEHNMQELRRRDGVTALIAGAGGHGHYSLDDGDDRLAWSDDRTDGALRLRLRPGRADYAFVAADGRVLRRGVATCRGQEQGAAAPARSGRVTSSRTSTGVPHTRPASR